MAQAAAFPPRSSRPNGLFLLLFTLCALCGEEVLAGRILVYPVDGSHWLNMNVLLRELHQRGHVLTVIRSSTSWYIPENAPHFSSITVPLVRASSLEDPEYMANFMQRNLELRQASVLAFIRLEREIVTMLWEAHQSSAEMVRLLLENSTLMGELKRGRFDLMLTDPSFPGGAVLGRYLGLPLVFNVRWITNADGHFAIAPSPLSYVPTIGSRVSDRMSFTNKLKNLLHYGIGVYLDLGITRPLYQGVCEEFLGPDTNVYKVIQGGDLWLMRVDFIFEFPRPTMPNVVYMGGFQCRPAQPLPPELEEFVQSSGEHGVVVMSLGTLLGGLPPHISEVIASAFARLPQKVLWRHLGVRPSTLGNNTLLLDWLPQNDLLGHPKTRAFVTHGGTNGLYEAIYHGVPVLGLPLIFDQMDNMVRMKARGVGIVLDVMALEVDSVTQALRDILNEQKPYRENMRRMSWLHRDRPVDPMDSALFWIEFVIRHGGAAHLRTESYKMPWYAYHNLDVLALVLGSAIALLLLVSATCKCLFQRLCRTRKVKLQ